VSPTPICLPVLPGSAASQQRAFARRSLVLPPVTTHAVSVRCAAQLPPGHVPIRASSQVSGATAREPGGEWSTSLVRIGDHRRRVDRGRPGRDDAIEGPGPCRDGAGRGEHFRRLRRHPADAGDVPEAKAIAAGTSGMSANLAALLYLASAVLFILELRGLSNPESARTGNVLGMIGMALAIMTTALGPQVTTFGRIALAIWAGRDRRTRDRVPPRDGRDAPARSGVSQPRRGWPRCWWRPRAFYHPTGYEIVNVQHNAQSRIEMSLGIVRPGGVEQKAVTRALLKIGHSMLLALCPRLTLRGLR